MTDFNIKEIKSVPPPKSQIMKCGKCGKENESKLWRCQFCDAILHPEELLAARKKSPRNYMFFSVLLILSCMPTAFISCYYGIKVNSSFIKGEYFKAEEYSKKARMWVWISFILSIIATLVAISYIMPIYTQTMTQLKEQMKGLDYKVQQIIIYLVCVLNTALITLKMI